MINEVWKPIKGYEGVYEISSFGRVKSLDRTIRHTGCLGGKNKLRKEGMIRKCGKNTNGYPSVTITFNSREKTRAVHRFVAEAFLPNPQNKFTVNHKNGIKTDNRVENLEWMTQTENIRHAFKTGLKSREQHFKKVVQIKDGKVVKIWDSLMEAAVHCGFDRSGISHCCGGEQKTAGGFGWKFI